MPFAFLLAASLQAPIEAVIELPECQANQLSLSFDGEGGNFDGMSHSGTLMVFRNIGDTACRLPALPRLTFQDGAGRPVDLARRIPPGLHPGPVVLPVGLAAGAEATAALRWVSGDVYDGHHCVTPVTVSVPIGTGTVTAPFSAQLCGPAGQPVPFDQAWLKVDPVLGAGTGGGR